MAEHFEHGKTEPMLRPTDEEIVERFAELGRQAARRLHKIEVGATDERAALIAENERLRAELAELSAWREGKKGVEEFYAMREMYFAQKRARAELRAEVERLQAQVPVWTPFADPLTDGPLPQEKQLVWVAKKDGSVFIYTFSAFAAPWALVNSVAWMPAVVPAAPDAGESEA